MFWNFHFVICIYFKFLQIFFYAFVNVISFNGNMVRLRFPVKIENKKKKRENKSKLQITKNYNDISNASKIETIDRKTKKKRQKKKKLLHESDRFKEEEEKRRAR